MTRSCVDKIKTLNNIDINLSNKNNICTYDDDDHHHHECSAQGQVLLQGEEPRLQFCRKQVFHRKLRNQGCSFTRDWRGAVTYRCFPHPTLSLTSKQTLQNLKRSQGHQCGGEESGYGKLGPPDFPKIHHRGISSIRVFDQIRDPEIPIILLIGI